MLFNKRSIKGQGDQQDAHLGAKPLLLQSACTGELIVTNVLLTQHAQNTCPVYLNYAQSYRVYGKKKSTFKNCSQLTWQC